MVVFGRSFGTGGSGLVRVMAIACCWRVSGVPGCKPGGFGGFIVAADL